MQSTVKKQILTWVALVLGATLLSFISILFVPSSAPAEPSISWSPTSVTEMILAGETKTVAVSFASSENISNVSVRVVPELQPYVRVSPSSFSSITSGQNVNLNIIISSPTTSLPATFDGTIQLRNASGKNQITFARPLPITLAIQWSAFDNTNFGYHMNYPPAFDIAEESSPGRVLDLPGLLSLVAIDDPEKPPGMFTIAVFSNSQQLSVSDWVDSAEAGSYSDDVQVSDLTVCNVPAKEYVSTEEGHRSIYFANGNEIFALEWNTYTPADLVGLSQFNFIVSTFSCS